MTLREDPITGALRLVAPGRAPRLRPRTASCPFCIGGEPDTPAETDRIEDEDGSWIARAFPNRFPLTDPHEVLVPSPRHVTAWRELELRELEAGLELLARRRRALQGAGRYVHAFANDGTAAGASIAHVHAQVVSVPAGDHAARLTRNVREPDDCALCGLLADDAVVVERGRHVALLAHPVPRLAGGLLLAPLDHHDLLGVAPAPELAALLHRALQALDPELACNLWLVAEPDAHWYLELQPRSAGIAGLELALGLHVCASDASETAAHARERLAMPGR